MDYEQIKKAAEGYKADMARFLRAMISHPSESCEEKEVVACIKAEMEKLGYDAVEVDGLGNVIGWRLPSQARICPTRCCVLQKMRAKSVLPANSTERSRPLLRMLRWRPRSAVRPACCR